MGLLGATGPQVQEERSASGQDLRRRTASRHLRPRTHTRDPKLPDRANTRASPHARKFRQYQPCRSFGPQGQRQNGMPRRPAIRARDRQTTAPSPVDREEMTGATVILSGFGRTLPLLGARVAGPLTRTIGGQNARRRACPPPAHRLVAGPSRLPGGLLLARTRRALWEFYQSGGGQVRANSL